VLICGSRPPRRTARVSTTDVDSARTRFSCPPPRAELLQTTSTMYSVALSTQAANGCELETNRLVRRSLHLVVRGVASSTRNGGLTQHPPYPRHTLPGSCSVREVHITAGRCETRPHYGVVELDRVFAVPSVNGGLSGRTGRVSLSAATSFGSNSRRTFLVLCSGGVGGGKWGKEGGGGGGSRGVRECWGCGSVREGEERMGGGRS